jgi:cell shape-determining protein MreC
MLKQANVRTVEDLAVLSETGLRNVGFGARGLQEKARNFLVSAAGDGKVSAELNHLKVKNESLKLRVEELERQNNELRAQFRVEKNIPNNNWETVPEGDTT